MNDRDASAETEQVLIDLSRQMPAGMKFRRVFDAYQTGKMLAMTGLRQHYPEASEKRIWHLWTKQHLGDELFKEVYGAAPDE